MKSHPSKKLLPLLFLAAFILAVLPGPGEAEFYRYVDKDGKVRYTDDPSKVPSSGNAPVKSYSEDTDALTPEEKEELDRQRRERDARRKEDRKAKARAEKERKEGRASVKKREETRVTIANSQVIVPVTLSYQGQQVTVNLLLDTGAQVTAIDIATAERLNIEDPEMVAMQVAGGGVIPAGLATLDQIRVGPKTKRGVQVIILPQASSGASYNGLLGMSFLGGLHYTIDFGNHVIRWE